MLLVKGSRMSGTRASPKFMATCAITWITCLQGLPFRGVHILLSEDRSSSPSPRGGMNQVQQAWKSQASDPSQDHDKGNHQRQYNMTAFYIHHAIQRSLSLGQNSAILQRQDETFKPLLPLGHLIQSSSPYQSLNRLHQCASQHSSTNFLLGNGFSR